MTPDSRGKGPVPNRATLMLRIFVLATLLLISSATALGPARRLVVKPPSSLPFSGVG